MFESVTDPSRSNWKLRSAGIAVIVALLAGFVWIWRMTQMPLHSYRGSLPALTAEQLDLESRLSAHVKHLSGTIGERDASQAGKLHATTDYIQTTLQQMGYTVTEQPYSADGKEVQNLEARLDGNVGTNEVVVVGAHYDTVAGTVGANDNASGVAATLELARMLRQCKLQSAIRFVFFANEEPPYFQTNQMGSLVYARGLRRDHLALSAMISLETIGFYSDAAGSQKYPALLSLFYPSRGNFVGFVGNTESRDLVRRAVREFRASTSFPSEGISAPADWPGIGWSDQWAFWQEGYPAIMVTDTAPFRYPYYHTTTDTSEKINYDQMTRVVVGVRNVVVSLASER